MYFVVDLAHSQILSDLVLGLSDIYRYVHLVILENPTPIRQSPTNMILSTPQSRPFIFFAYERLALYLVLPSLVLLRVL